MGKKYSNAPISELIFGLLFNSGVLNANGIIFSLIDELMKDYPKIQTQPSIFEEDWHDNKLSANLDYEKSGFSLYRLYNKDESFMIQIQQNCVILNWIRKDGAPVGSYPGFTKIYEEFARIISVIQDKISKQGIDFNKSIKNISLTYQDRVIMDKDNSVKKILTLGVPTMSFGGKEILPATILNRYVLPCDELSGFHSISINTGKDINKNRLLVIETKIKGSVNENYKDLKSWFVKSHDLQVESFDNLFTKEILAAWQ